MKSLTVIAEIIDHRELQRRNKVSLINGRTKTLRLTFGRNQNQFKVNLLLSRLVRRLTNKAKINNCWVIRIDIKIELGGSGRSLTFFLTASFAWRKRP